MKAFFCAICLVIFACEALAQKPPAIQIATDKDIYFPGDSVHWQCALSGFGKGYNAVTLQLWIESLHNGMKWSYRFPVINGYAEGAMRISSDMPPGSYAFNFLLQPDFFNVAGKLEHATARDSILNYFVIFKGQETMLEQVKTGQDGRFSIAGLVYQDTAMFTFTEAGKKRDVPTIRLSTSLDSAFTPVLPAVTKFIHIAGASARDSGATTDIQRSKDYRFRMNDAFSGHQLGEVVVKDRRSDKLLKEYSEAYVSPQFRTADDITLDGLTNDDILKAGDIYQYLTMHVPGLTISMNPETGTQEIKWRNTDVAIYVDEFRLPDNTPLTVQPGEVAMIKVFRPGSGPLTGGSANAGSVAIYTKVGPYSRFLPAGAQSNRFYIRGYDGRSVEWKY